MRSSRPSGRPTRTSGRGWWALCLRICATRTILGRARSATARATCTRTTSTTASSRSVTHPTRWRTAGITSRHDMAWRLASPNARSASGPSLTRPRTRPRRSSHDTDGPAMNAVELAALIAAVFWALLVCVGVFVLFRLGRLLSESSRLVADVRERGDVLLQRAQTAVDGAQAAVDRAGPQLDRTESVTASMDELGSGMTELAGQVTALAGLGRAIAGGPVGRVGALAYGVRHAVGLRRPARRTLPGRVVKRDELPGRATHQEV